MFNFFKKIINDFLEDDYLVDDHDKHWLMLRDKYNYLLNIKF